MDLLTESTAQQLIALLKEQNSLLRSNAKPVAVPTQSKASAKPDYDEIARSLIIKHIPNAQRFMGEK